MIRQDYIQRAIEELARAVAALLAKPGSSPEEVLREVLDAKRHIPLTPGLIDVLSGRDLAERLSDERLRTEVAQLLRLEGEAHRALGNEVHASRLLRRCEALLAANSLQRLAPESQSK